MEGCQERIFKVDFKLIICIRFVRFWFKLLNTCHHRWVIGDLLWEKILKFCEDCPEEDDKNNVLVGTLVILFFLFWILLIFGLSYCTIFRPNQLARRVSSTSSSSPPSSPPPPLFVNQPAMPTPPPPPPPMAGATIQSYQDLPPPPAYESTLFP